MDGPETEHAAPEDIASGHGASEAPEAYGVSRARAKRAITTARLLQAHFAMHRARMVLLTRAPESELRGEAKRVVPVDSEECRTFTDAAEAEAFIRQSIDAGDVVGIGWSPDEMDAFERLQVIGCALGAAGCAFALIIGPHGAARVELSTDDLPHAAQVLGTAALLGLHVLLEQEVAR